MTQGQHIAGLLKDAGLSINKAAKLAGISREHLSRIVNDHDGIGPDVAEKLAPVLNVTVDVLVLPKAEEVETRRGFDRRLQSLADDLAAAVEGQAKLAREVARLRARIVRLEARPWPGQDEATG